MSNIIESEPEWLIPGYIPKQQITTLSGDGGTGKSTTACAIAAAVSSGGFCFLTSQLEQRVSVPNKPGKVLFLSSEDSFSYTLKRRLRLYNADLEKISTVQISDPNFGMLKLGSDQMKSLIVQSKPTLLILDPLQSFIPPEINMGSRNAMRDCLNVLIEYGEALGITTLILSHTNKRQNASGRDRIADSADLWDISRSVLISGIRADGKERYLSHEKCNYGALQETILYKLENEKITVTGYSEKRDSFYQSERSRAGGNSAPARDEAEELILDSLDQEGMKISDLDATVKNAGISTSALRKAKAHLKKEGKVRLVPKGGGKTKEWFIYKGGENLT